MAGFSTPGVATHAELPDVSTPHTLADLVAAVCSETEAVNVARAAIYGLQSPDYGGGIRALTEDADYVYAAGTTTFTVRKYKKSDMTLALEGPDYGGTIYALTQDADYVYAGGSTTNKVRKYNKSDMTLALESPTYGGTIYALTQDANYVYAAGTTTQKVTKYIL